MALLLKAPLSLGSSAILARGQQRKSLATGRAFPVRATVRAEADLSAARESGEVRDDAQARRDLPVVHSPSVVGVEASAAPSNESSQSAARSFFVMAAQHCAILIAAGALVMSPAFDADAAQSGGRVGGQAFSRSRAAPPPPRPRTQIRSNTNVYVAPPVVVAPPIYGGGFFAPPPFFGGWGFSPYVVTPGPTVAIGVGGGGIGFFFNFFFFTIIAGVVFGVVRGLFRRDDDRY